MCALCANMSFLSSSGYLRSWGMDFKDLPPLAHCTSFGLRWILGTRNKFTQSYRRPLLCYFEPLRLPCCGCLHTAGLIDLRGLNSDLSLFLLLLHLFVSCWRGGYWYLSPASAFVHWLQLNVPAIYFTTHFVCRSVRLSTVGTRPLIRPRRSVPCSPDTILREVDWIDRATGVQWERNLTIIVAIGRVSNHYLQHISFRCTQDIEISTTKDGIWVEMNGRAKSRMREGKIFYCWIELLVEWYRVT
jgi:hypothetical protein